MITKLIFATRLQWVVGILLLLLPFSQPVQADVLLISNNGENQVLLGLEGGSVSVIDRQSGTVRSLDFDSSQIGLDISPNGREVWVHQGPHSIVRQRTGFHHKPGKESDNEDRFKRQEGDGCVSNR